MFGFSAMELLIFAVIVLLLFGSRLPSAMKSLGMSLSSFKKGMREGDEEERQNLESDKKSES